MAHSSASLATAVVIITCTRKREVAPATLASQVKVTPLTSCYGSSFSAGLAKIIDAFFGRPKELS